jgi:hypothetical protein
MASGRPEGKPVIVIARPRFLDPLAEGTGTSFNQQQRNDFALGLVHEVVHLQSANPGNPADLEDRLHEELGLARSRRECCEAVPKTGSTDEWGIYSDRRRSSILW